MDELLRREYIDNVPLGYCDDVFSLYQPGWGFDRDDVYRTGAADGFGMPVTVKVNNFALTVQDAEFIPSYVTSHFTSDEMRGGIENNVSLNPVDVYGKTNPQDFEYPQVDASFVQTKWSGRHLGQLYDGSLGGDAFWNTYRESDDQTSHPVPEQGDWTSITFAEKTAIVKVRISILTDSSALALPTSIIVQYKENKEDFVWKDVPGGTRSSRIVEGWNEITFDEIEAEAYRVVLPAQSGKCVGADELELIQNKEIFTADKVVDVTGYKYVSPDSKLVTVVKAKNTGKEPMEVEVSAQSSVVQTRYNNRLTGQAASLQACIRGDSGFEVVGSS